MALFNPNGLDKKLHPLTQFFQVEGIGEIDALFRRLDPGWEEYAPVVEALPSVDDDQMYKFPNNEIREWEKAREHRVKEFNRRMLEVQPCVKNFMIAMADDSLIDVQDVEKLVDWYNSTFDVRAFFLHPTSKHGGFVLHIPREEKYEYPEKIRARSVTYQRGGIFQVNEGERKIIESLLEWDWKKLPFCRCESCKSVFPPTREGQRYCSQRCRARVGSRRRYAKLFEGHSSGQRGIFRPP
jgi:hypothetical protein